MRRITFWACIGLVCVLGISGISAQETAPAGSAPAASVPRLIKFSGELRDLAGKPLTGLSELHFAIYQEQTDTVALWQETQTLQLDEQGRYSVLLGAMQAEGLPVELFTSGEARWLGIAAGKLPEQPRVLMVSVPYALKAADAETLGGKPASAYALADQAATTVLAVGRTANSDAPQRADVTGDLSADGQPKALVTSGQTHFLGTTSDYVLRITQYGTGRGLHGLSQSGEAVYGQVLGTSGTTYGVRGMTPSTTGAGVFGQSTATTGPSYGVRGQTSNPVGGGVFGYNQATSGSAYGVIGQTKSAEGMAILGRALASSGAATGVAGKADSPSGTAVLAEATANTGATTGLLSKVHSPEGIALITDNAGGGQLLSGRVDGVEKLSVTGNGNLTTAGNVTAASFAGSGAALTGVNALTAASAATATTAATAGNADNLGGVPAASHARRDTANTFNGNQMVNGALTVNGPVSGTQFYGDGSTLSVNGTALANVLARLQALENIVLPPAPVTGAHMFSKAFPTVYVEGFGSQDDDRGAAVAVDPSGNIFITGWTMGPVDFGGGPLTVPSRTGGGLFLAKFSGVDGSHLWSKVLGSADSNGQGKKIAVDAGGNVILGGTFNGTMDFGGGPPLPAPGPYNQGAFVAKFSGVNGSHIWSRAFPYSQYGLGASVAVDAAGRVLVTGAFIGTGDFGGGPVTSAGGGDVFVAEYSGVDGSHLWSRHFAASLGGYGLGEGVAADASGNVVVTGTLAGTMDFGGGPLTYAGGSDIFVAKFSGVDGSHLWSKHFAHAYGRFPSNPMVAVDTNGNVCLTGGFFDGADFGGGPMTGGDQPTIFVAKFSGADGTHLWSKGFGALPRCSGASCSGYTWGHGIAVDTSGNVVVTGESTGTVDFGAGPLTGLGPYGDCMLVAKFTGADGSHIWSKCFSSSNGGASAAGLAVDASGSVLVTGDFSYMIDFGGGPLTSTPSQEEPGYYPPDIYLLKLHF